MNKNLEIWEDIFQNNEWGKYPSLAVVRFVARNFYKVPNRKDIRILELGCGTGANLWYCAREGFSVIGLDGSKTAINTMISRFNAEHLNSNLIYARDGDYSLTIEDIEDDSLDAIIDVESLYCNSFSKTRQIIQKSFKKLKVGGKMMSQTFGDDTLGIGFNCKNNVDCEDEFYHAEFPKSKYFCDKGFFRYTTKEDIEKLYKLDNNEINSIHRLDYVYNEDEKLKEWIIEIEKKC